MLLKNISDLKVYALTDRVFFFFFGKLERIKLGLAVSPLLLSVKTYYLVNHSSYHRGIDILLWGKEK
jgi:hypothetical protein